MIAELALWGAVTGKAPAQGDVAAALVRIGAWPVVPTLCGKDEWTR